MAASLAPALSAMEKVPRGRDAAGAASSRSRSTSAGSSPAQSSSGSSPPPVAADSRLGFPESDGPTPVNIQTWQGLVDWSGDKASASLLGGKPLNANAPAFKVSLFNGLCQAPPPGLGAPPGLELGDAAWPSPTAAAAALAESVAAAALAGDEEAEAKAAGASQWSRLSASSPPWEPHAPVLCLAETLPQAAVGTPECPTAGSAGHFQGRCKPCAFVHTKGCGNGVLCSFCHLCQPGEKKRRQKVTRSYLRSEGRVERVL